MIGPTESPPLPGPAEPGTRYICFTDREAPGWECRAPPAMPPRQAARRVKTHLHELGAEVSIWVDASFDLIAPPSVIAEAAAATKAGVVGFAHPDRDRISDEAAEIQRLGLAPANSVDAQMKAYRSAGFDPDARRPLTTTGLLVRHHSKVVEAFDLQWWLEISLRTLRDQLSVDYAAWKAGLRIGYLPGHYRDNCFARYNRVRHRQGRT